METTTAETTNYVQLDPEQLNYLAEVSQGNTYAVIGCMFFVIVVLGGIFLTTLLR
ncbi:hypothetical protein [Rubrobacter indicoceani]|uniref:hypothetical protein n=1 Tax=Rubrobacter indicoceani TaxID=2051957 RepID=UPI0013C4641E|nr:hypothetical protein [Rubrobacter indicoceani]